jgi:NifU-like protein involved in Fe-S cluster formation
MYNEIIVNYSKNPVNKGELDNFDVEYFEENEIC